MSSYGYNFWARFFNYFFPGQYNFKVHGGGAGKQYGSKSSNPKNYGGKSYALGKSGTNNSKSGYKYRHKGKK